MPNQGLLSSRDSFQVHDTSLAEDGLLGAASLMMFITVAYIGSDLSGMRGRGGFSLSLIKSHHNNSLPVSIPASHSRAIQNEVEQPQPRFCVCLQQMPEPTLSPDWFDMQPTRELSGGQVRMRLVGSSSNFNRLLPRCKSSEFSSTTWHNPFSFFFLFRASFATSCGKLLIVTPFFTCPWHLEHVL